MIEDDRDCSEVLVQIAAVRSAINNIGKIILEDHISHCLVDAVETGDEHFSFGHSLFIFYSYFIEIHEILNLFYSSSRLIFDAISAIFS